MMIEVTEITTYPFQVRLWPNDAFYKRNTMQNWLDANVKWEGKLEISDIAPSDGVVRKGVKQLHYVFRVHSLEDVGLVKLRCS